MTEAVPVLDFLTRLIGSHTFKGAMDEVGHNYDCRIDKVVKIRRENGDPIAVPVGTELVVYRHPRQTSDRKQTVACFFYPRGNKQIVVYGSGRTKTRYLTHDIS